MKAPELGAAPAISANWTGLYLGLHGGGARSYINPQLVDTNGGGFDDPRLGPTKYGALGGAQLGYNWQISRGWLLGLEGDFSWASLSNSNVKAPATAGGGVVPPSSISMATDVRWLASARGRIGYVADRALLYVTGGAAWANVAYSGLVIGFAPFTSSTSFSKTQSGWVLGPGIEWSLADHWTVRGEYLY